MQMDWRDLSLSEDRFETYPCECCGKLTHEAGGIISEKGTEIAGFLVRWTAKETSHDAEFRLYTGDWSSEGKPEARQVTRADYRKSEGSFMVIDAFEGVADTSNATYLGRDEVLGTAFGQEIYAMLDAIFIKHSKLEEWRR